LLQGEFNELVVDLKLSEDARPQHAVRGRARSRVPLLIGYAKSHAVLVPSRGGSWPNEAAETSLVHFIRLSTSQQLVSHPLQYILLEQIGRPRRKATTPFGFISIMVKIGHEDSGAQVFALVVVQVSDRRSVLLSATQIIFCDLQTVPYWLRPTAMCTRCKSTRIRR